MSKFPLVEKLGLTVYAQTDIGSVVYAGDLESILQSAQVVKRKEGMMLWTEDFTIFSYDPDEQGILLCVEPIKKKTKAEAALEFVSEVNSGKFNGWKVESVQAEAKRILEMKDEV